MFTQVRSADRRVAPVEGQNHASVMKAVYVVLEPQYQNALTQAATALNASGGDLGIELSGYLIEELRNDEKCGVHGSQRHSRLKARTILSRVGPLNADASRGAAHRQAIRHVRC